MPGEASTIGVMSEPSAKTTTSGVAELTDAAPRTVHWAFLGRMDYAPCAELQARVRQGVLDGTGPETLLFVEHPHVYTLGRNADRADVLTGESQLAARGIQVEQSDRGGHVTYHGPGQIVGYPILDLETFGIGIRAYIELLEESITQFKWIVDIDCCFHIKFEAEEQKYYILVE